MFGESNIELFKLLEEGEEVLEMSCGDFGVGQVYRIGFEEEFVLWMIGCLSKVEELVEGLSELGLLDLID